MKAIVMIIRVGCHSLERTVIITNFIAIAISTVIVIVSYLIIHGILMTTIIVILSLSASISLIFVIL
jgi:hypothetical protein